MAFSNLFRRYSMSTDIQSASYGYVNKSSIAETLLDELEGQCQNCSALASLKKRNSQNPESLLDPTGNLPAAKRHSSVDYSWLTPNNNQQCQASHDIYQLSDIIKMELGELIRNVLAEDCTGIINQFRRHIRAETKIATPENTIALFRKTISDYIDQKPRNRLNLNSNNDLSSSNSKSTAKTTINAYAFGRTNRINPKYQLDDEQHCIAELTEISITSSSNDGADHQKLRSSSQT